MNWYRAWGKRALDLAIVAALAPIAAPVVMVLGLAIVAVDRHKPIFRQKRVGRNRRPFTVYKLRTLPDTTGNTPTHETDLSGASNLAKVLRKSKLDELPQLFNVAIGDMSLVGPRPCLTSQKQLIGERQTRGVFAVRPGITGRSQIVGLDMSEPIALAKSDAVYANNISFLDDIKILIGTLM